MSIKNPWVLIQKEKKFWYTHDEKGSEIQTKLLIIKFESLKEFLVFSVFTADMGATPFSEQDLFLNLNFFQRSYRLFH